MESSGKGEMNLFKGLNVGCGTSLLDGWDNLDQHDKNGANIVVDITKKLPINDDVYDVVLCSHVLEDFCDPIPIINELIRITKVNGLITIKVPSDTNLLFGNPLHKHQFTLFKLISLASDNTYYGTTSNIEVESYAYYNGGHTTWGAICTAIRNHLGYKISEATIIKYLFPITDITITYKKTKELKTL